MSDTDKKRSLSEAYEKSCLNRAKAEQLEIETRLKWEAAENKLAAAIDSERNAFDAWQGLYNE